MGNLLESFVELEGDSGGAGARLPAVDTAAHRRSAQAIAFFHQYDVDIQSRRAETSAAAADHSQLAADFLRRCCLAGQNQHRRQAP